MNVLNLFPELMSSTPNDTQEIRLARYEQILIIKRKWPISAEFSGGRKEINCIN